MFDTLRRSVMDWWEFPYILAQEIRNAKHVGICKNCGVYAPLRTTVGQHPRAEPLFCLFCLQELTTIGPYFDWRSRFFVLWRLIKHCVKPQTWPALTPYRMTFILRFILSLLLDHQSKPFDSLSFFYRGWCIPFEKGMILHLYAKDKGLGYSYFCEMPEDRYL